MCIRDRGLVEARVVAFRFWLHRRASGLPAASGHHAAEDQEDADADAHHQHHGQPDRVEARRDEVWDDELERPL
eukprot:14818664-Alexandrium_andersonii.AAC.1